MLDSCITKYKAGFACQIFSKHSALFEFQYWKQDKEMEWVEEGQLPNDPVQSREILISLHRNLGHVEGNVQVCTIEIVQPVQKTEQEFCFLENIIE